MDDLAKDIFRTANIFNHAASVINKKMVEELENKGSTMLPAAGLTNCMLALELYLKCLYVLESGKKIIRTHSIKELYDSITPAAQSEIQTLFEEAKRQNPTMQALASQFPDNEYSLDAVLELVNEAFIEWRYAFEKNAGSLYGHAELIFATRTYILERKPEWKLL